MLYVYLSGYSFASGGDSDSLDYIAYVAKDNAGIALTTHSYWHFMYMYSSKSMFYHTLLPTKPQSGRFYECLSQ
jgi:hypothetical protein